MGKRIRSILGRRGFTLIELLVITAIIALLSSIALLQFKNYQEKTANTAAVDDLRNAKALLEAFHADYQVYP
jgi:prepilin-type N-terminal cleavage/methylation domain-containing protein